MPTKIGKINEPKSSELTDPTYLRSEQKMQEWVSECISQVDTIDEFFCERFQLYVDEFIELQAKFMQKLENEQAWHDTKKRKKEKKRRKQREEKRKTEMHAGEENERNEAKEERGEDSPGRESGWRFISPLDGAEIMLNRNQRQGGLRNQNGFGDLTGESTNAGPLRASQEFSQARLDHEKAYSELNARQSYLIIAAPEGDNESIF